MSKIGVIAVILGFWLALPLVFQFLGLSGYTNIKDSMTTIDSIEPPSNALTYITTFLSFLKYYFTTVFIWVAGMPTIINYFLWFLRLMSAFVLIVTLKE